MDSNIIKFTSISEGESSYSIELSMPFIGISVDSNNKPVSLLTYTCDISVMRGTTKLLPSTTAAAGTYKLQLITTTVNGLKNITIDNTNGQVRFTTDTLTALDNGFIEFYVLLETDSNRVLKSISFSPLQGLHGSDGLTYSFDYDNGQLVKFRNGNLFEYTPKIFRIAGYRRRGTEAREKLTNIDYYLTASIFVNNTEISMPVSWDSTNQVFFISFEDDTVITVGNITDYITQFNIRKLTVTVFDVNDSIVDQMRFDVNYGTSDDAANLVLNPTSIIGAIQNTKISFNSEGLDIFRGGLRIYKGTSKQTERVFDIDQNGNLQVRGSITNGSAMAGWAIREHTMISGSGLVGIGDGNVESPAGDYSFWAGNEDPSEAPFSVKKTGEMKATLLEIGGTQITPGTIRTGALAPGAVDNNALAENAVDSDNIRQGAIITNHLSANIITVDKLASDVGQSLDLSSNTSINLIAGDIRDEVKFEATNASGQMLTITFTNGNAFEYGKSNIVAVAHLWKNGEDITDRISSSAFRWWRYSSDPASDTLWNIRNDHKNTKQITIPRSEILKSCMIRCSCEETVLYDEVTHKDNGDVAIAVPVDMNLNMYVTQGNLYGKEGLFKVKDGVLYVNTYSDYIQVESSVFDHSMLQSSHILIQDEKIDISSGGDLNLLAGADLNVKATANINVEANGNLNIQNGGNLKLKTGGSLSMEASSSIKVNSDSNININNNGNFNVKSGGNFNIKNNGNMAIENGGSMSIQNGGGMTINSGGNLTINNGGNLTINNGGKLNIRTSDIMIGGNDSLQTELDTMTGDISTANTTAGTASTNASTALANANTAITNAATANTTANTALSTANTANTNASTANTNASEAKTTANNASAKANSAATAANEAKTTANEAKTLANTANTTANNKSKTFVQTSIPTSGYKAGDIWEDSDDNYKTYTAIGSPSGTPSRDWVLISAGKIRGAAITGDMDSGTLTIASGKSLTIASGGTLQLAGNNSVTIGSGGTVNMVGASLNIRTSSNGNSISMNSNGISMKANSYFNIESGGSVKINAGSIDAEGSYISLGNKFSVDTRGDLYANSGTFTQAVRVNGYNAITRADLPQDIIYSDSQPSGHNILWITPIATDGEGFSRTATYQVQSFGTTIVKNRSSINFAMVLQNNRILAKNNFKYKLIMHMKKPPASSNSGWHYFDNVSITVTLAKGAKSLSMTTVAARISDSLAPVECIFETTSNTNLCESTANITLTVTPSWYGANELKVQVDSSYPVVLEVSPTGTGDGSKYLCDIYYIP